MALPLLVCSVGLPLRGVAWGGRCHSLYCRADTRFEDIAVSASVQFSLKGTSDFRASLGRHSFFCAPAERLVRVSGRINMPATACVGSPKQAMMDLLPEGARVEMDQPHMGFIVKYRGGRVGTRSITFRGLGNARADAVKLAWAAHTEHTGEECPYEYQIEELRQNDAVDEAVGDE